MASGATMIAEVDSLPLEAEARAETVTYTRLGLWWIEDEHRPFYAVVEGLCGPAADEWMENRFRAVPYGTMDRALNSFDPTNLHAELLEAIESQGYLSGCFPDANELRRKRAQARRGYQGPDDMRKAIEWLYDNVGAPLTVTAKRVEADFGVPWRTVYNALQGKPTTGWAPGFIAAMRHFDRGAWNASRAKADEEQCAHEAWNEIGGGKRCADCNEWLGQVDQEGGTDDPVR